MNEQLDLIAEHADLIARAARDADRKSMETARAMDDLYEKREWVAEWLEQKPRPKNGGSNRWKEDSRDRFGAWLAWKQQQRGREALTRTYTWRLMTAARIERISNVASGNIRSEFALRPLSLLIRNRYEDHLPEVMAKAVELAGGDLARLTQAHTKQARADWEKQVFGNRRDGTPRSSAAAITAAAAAAGKANRARVAAEENFDALAQLALYDEKAKDELRAFLEHVEDVLRSGQAAA